MAAQNGQGISLPPLALLRELGVYDQDGQFLVISKLRVGLHMIRRRDDISRLLELAPRDRGGVLASPDAVAQSLRAAVDWLGK